MIEEEALGLRPNLQLHDVCSFRVVLLRVQFGRFQAVQQLQHVRLRIEIPTQGPENDVPTTTESLHSRTQLPDLDF